ncbi:glycosyltransferase family 2 protein [Thioalkalivibrio sp.]|uniref:glycosyltransferase family 2 protein n=1 Tax=Thioalkalivibrio sp. TaxID=2093813 RepID=UPI003565636E
MNTPFLSEAGEIPAGAPSRFGSDGTWPLVSVIIPFLDPPDAFLREAVASVTCQDYRPIELILANDGSSPATVSFARSLLEQTDLPGCWVEHPGGGNRGCSATRNLGAAAARGEFIAFIDADDTWADGKVAEQVELLSRDPTLALVFGSSLYWYSWSRDAAGGQQDVVRSYGAENLRRIKPPGFIADFLRGRIIAPSMSNLMVRRDAFMACGGFEECFRGMYEDQAFLVKLGLGHAVCAAPRCWDRYRQHPESMTAQADAAGAELAARRDFLAWVQSHCRAQSVMDPGLWEALNKEVWLAGQGRASGAAPQRRSLRWLRKWYLRVEELVIPDRLRYRLWGQC